MLFENDIVYLLLKVILITGGTQGMMFTLTRFRYRLKRILLIFSLYFIWVALSSAVIIQLGGFRLLSQSFLGTISLPAVFITYHLAKDSPAQAVFNYTTQISISLLLTASIVLINTAIGGSQITDLLLRLLAYALAILLEWHFLRKPFHDLTDVVQKGWGTLSLIPVSYCLLFFFLGVFPEHYLDHKIHIIYIYMAAITMVIVYYSVYQSLIRQLNIQMLVHDHSILNMQIESLMARTDSILKAEEKVRILRHDIKHIVSAIDASLRNGALNEAAASLSLLSDTLNITDTNRFCDKHVINAMLNYYTDKAKKNHIQMSVTLSAPPEDCINTTNFTVMLANAIDNAIIACQRLDENKIIELKGRIFNNQYVLELANTCDGHVKFGRDGLPQSFAGEDHGLGTRSILAFANDNDAIVTFQVNGSFFIMRMMIGLDKK